MSKDFVDFDPPAATSDEQADVVSSISRIASLNARAVMPDGSELSREQILTRLGLNPGTSPTAWLTVIGCGSNASALKAGDLQQIGIRKIASLSRAIEGKGPTVGSGFTDAGTMRDPESD